MRRLNKMAEDSQGWEPRLKCGYPQDGRLIDVNQRIVFSVLLEAEFVR